MRTGKVRRCGGPVERGLLALLLVAIAAVVPAPAGEEILVDGVRHVRNGPVPSQSPTALELRELWRVGGEDEDVVFGLLLQVRSDEDGNIYLLDTQLSHILVYSPDGRFLQTLSREGDGPGEVRQPYDMFLADDGSIGLAQMFPGKIIRIDRQGTPLGTIQVRNREAIEGGFSIVMDANHRAGNTVLAGLFAVQDPTGQSRTGFLSSFSDEGEEQVRYWERSSRIDYVNVNIVEKDQYFVFPRLWAIGPRGEVYAAPRRDRYVIHVYAADGTLERVIEREYVPPKRTEQQLRRTTQLMDAQLRVFGREVDREIADTEPVITSIRVSEDGMIWVLSSRGVLEQPAGTMLTYDLFDPRGHFVRQASVRCGGDPLEDGLFFVGEDRMVLVTGFVDAALAMLGGGGAVAAGEGEEVAPTEVVCYQVTGG